MNAQTKNIVFDWNGTLLEDTADILDCLNIILQRAGHAAIDMVAYRKHYEVPFEKFYQNFGLSRAEMEKFNLLQNNVFHDHYEPRAAVANLREGAAEILGHAQSHNVQSLILSNHLVEPIRTQLRRLEIENLFAEVLAYADRATQFRDMTKGDRLQNFIAERGLQPRDTMIVGDSVEEVQIARDQGLISVAITGGCVSEERLRAENPDYLIHSLHELKPIMMERGFVS